MALDPAAAVRLSLNPQEFLGRRLAKLKALKQHAVQVAAGSKAGQVPYWLFPSLQQLLPLLLDPQPDVRSSAAATVATLGAQLAAAQPPLTRGPPDPSATPTLLFDWTAAVLCGKTPPVPALPAQKQSLLPGQQATLLSAMCQALQVLPAGAATSSAALSAMLGTCIHLLEAPSTTTSLIGPLLTTLNAALDADQRRLQAAGTSGPQATGTGPLGRVFVDLVDLLLGWSLDPTLDQADRSSIHSFFIASAVYWQRHVPFAVNLCNSMTQDLLAMTEPEAVLATSTATADAGSADAEGPLSTGTGTTTAAVPATLQASKPLDVPGCVRLAASLVSLMCAAGPVRDVGRLPPATYPSAAASGLLQQLPLLLTAASRLLRHTQQQHATAQQRLHDLMAAPPAPTAPARRAHTANKAAAEAQLATHIEHHALLTAFVCSALQQVPPIMRDWIMGDYIRSPLPPALAIVFSRPACPTTHTAFDSLGSEMNSKAVATQQTSTQSSEAVATDATDSLPEVHALVLEIFARVKAVSSEAMPVSLIDAVATCSDTATSSAEEQPGPVSDTAFLSTSGLPGLGALRLLSCSLPAEGAPPGREQMVAWLAGGAMELLLQAVSHPVTSPASIPGLLNTCAMLLCVEAGAGDEACIWLATDPRLLGPALQARQAAQPAHLSDSDGDKAGVTAVQPDTAGMEGLEAGLEARLEAGQGAGLEGAPEAQVPSVWMMRVSPEEATRQAVTAMLCDIMSMPGSLGGMVFDMLLSDILPEASSGHAAQMFSLATIQAAISKSALSAAHLAQATDLLASQLRKQAAAIAASARPAAPATAGITASSSPVPVGMRAGNSENDKDAGSATMFSATMDVWSACLLAKWWDGAVLDTDDSGEGVPGGRGPTASEIEQTLLLADDLLVVLEQRKPAMGSNAAGTEQVATAATAAALQVSTWPVTLLQQVRQHAVRDRGILRREGLLVLSPSLQDALLTLLTHMAQHTTPGVRLNCVHALELVGELHSSAISHPGFRSKLPAIQGSASHAITDSGQGERHAALKAGTGSQGGAEEAGTPVQQLSELPVQLATLALQLLGDSDVSVSSAALPLTLSFSAAPLLALGTSARAAACTQFVSTMPGAQGLLQPPSWHDSPITTAHMPVRCNWRPVQLARLFSLLFPEAGSLANLQVPAEASGTGAGPNPSPSPNPTPGVLLRRRGDAPVSDSSAIPASSPAAIIGTLIPPTKSTPDAPGSEGASADQHIIAPTPSPWVELAAALSPAEYDAGTPTPQPRLTTSTATDTPSPAPDPTPPAPPLPARHTHAPAAAWDVIQDAALACVTARLRTHVGGPSQSFAALDRLLHALLTRLQTLGSAATGAAGTQDASGGKTTAPDSDSTAAGVHESGWLALEFVDALERGVVAAIHGGPGSKGLPPAVMAFFATNRKVCEDWLGRTRHTRLQIAFALKAHHAVIMHGWQRLADLRDSMHALMPPPAPQQQQQDAPALSTAATTTVQAQPQVSALQPKQQSQQQQQLQPAAPAAAGSGLSRAPMLLQQPKRAPLTSAGGNAKAAADTATAAGLPRPAGPQAAAASSQGPTLLKKPSAAGVVAAAAGGAAAKGAAGSLIQSAAPALKEHQQGSAPAPPPATHVLHILAKELVDVLHWVGEALLALGEWESLEGLQSWALHTFAPLLRPSTATRATSTGHPPGQAGPTPTPLAEGALGHVPPQPTSSEDPLLWLLGYSQMAQGRYEQALAHFTTFLRQQAQRSASLAAGHSYTAPITQSHPILSQATPAALAGAKPASSPSLAQTSHPAAATPTMHPNSAATPSGPGAPIPPLAADQMAVLQPVVAGHAADCYASLTDWSHFHAFVTSQHRRAQTDARHAAWWGPCLNQQHMQDICALASFDINGPTNPELKGFTTTKVQAAVVAGLQAVHASHTRHASHTALPSDPKHTAASTERKAPAGGGRHGIHRHSSGTASGELVGRTDSGGHGPGVTVEPSVAPQLRVFLTALERAWPEVCEAPRRACWQGWNLGLRPAFTGSHLLTWMHAALTAHDNEHVATARMEYMPASCMQLLPMTQPACGMSHGPHGSAALSLAPLLLPTVSYTPGGRPGGGFDRSLVALPLLTQLLRAQHVFSPSPSTAATQQLLLLIAASARATGNTELVTRMCDKLAHSLSHSSPPVADSSGAASFSTPGPRSSVSQTALSAALLAVRAHVLAEVGAMQPTEAADRQLAAFHTLLQRPRDLLALAAAAKHSSHMPTVPVTSEPLVLGDRLTAVAAESAAAGLLSLAHWMGRCPPGSLNLQPGSRPGAGPSAITDWVSVLKMLAAPPTDAITHPHTKSLDPRAPSFFYPGPVAAVPTGTAGRPPGTVPDTGVVSRSHSGDGGPRHGAAQTAVPPKAAASDVRAVEEYEPLRVPDMVAKHHALEACAYAGAMRLAPNMPRAWLQWGMALLAWQREARQQQQQQQQQQQLQSTAKHGQRGSVPGVRAGVQSDEDQLVSAAVHALCVWLRCSWTQQELITPEDTTPALLRILQAVVRHGHSLESELQAHISLPPPGSWQALTPQLFAQLRHPQAGVRRLVLGLLQRVAAAAPFAVLYPALAEVQSTERAGGIPLAELQSLLLGLDASHPRLMDDVRTLMGEAERLTVTWEERWHGLLSELDVDVARRCVSLRAEAERLEQSWSVSIATQLAQSLRAAAPSPPPTCTPQRGTAEVVVPGVPGTALGMGAPAAAQPGRRVPAGGQQETVPASTVASTGRKASGRQGTPPPQPPACSALPGGPQASTRKDARAAQAAVVVPAEPVPKSEPTGKQAGRGRKDKTGQGAKREGRGRGTVVKLAPVPAVASAPVVNAWALPLPFVAKAGALAAAPAKPVVPLAGPSVPPAATGWGAGGIQDFPELDLATGASAAPLTPTGAIEGSTQADSNTPGGQSQEEGPDKAEEAQALAAAAAEHKRAILHTRYTALMSPVVLALERSLRACSACTPETPAEQDFVSKMLPQLTAAIAAFKAPPAEATSQLGTQPQVCWAPLKAVLQQLEEHLRRPTMNLPHVSPALAALKHSDVPMPGLAVTSLGYGTGPHHVAPHGKDQGDEDEESSKQAGQLAASLSTGSTVTIAGVHPVLRPLFTKTRPKRLVLLGSDGQQHVFLLKGRDDLRMDERLMQVLRVSNSLLRADNPSSQLGVAARHYSVTPLGERVGLIQWVDHTVSLFSLFRDWQGAMKDRHAAMVAARDAAPPATSVPTATGPATAARPIASSAAASRPAASASTAAPARPGGPLPPPRQVAGVAVPAAANPVPPLGPMVTAARPSDLFYARLLPELRAAGMPGMVPRKQWPQPVLRKVLAGLARQAPVQMVSHQLRGSSGSAISWWAKQRTYAASLAVNSMMGYLVGLGDRHLDNILLDTSTGELVHIDFNVCFEKGLKLRVPEVVPFRLTQSVAAGLGAAGGSAGGSFQSTCALVLSALQRRRDSLIALLDAVLGDPLVGWSEGSEREAAARRDLELAVTLSLFVSRMDESREPLSHQNQALLALFQGAGLVLLSFVRQYRAMEALQTAAKQAAEQLKEAQELAASTSAGLGPASAALQAAIVAHRALQADARALQEAGARVVSECNTWTMQHATVLTAVRDETVPEMSAPPQMWCFSAAQLPITLVLDSPGSGTAAAAPASSGLLALVMGAALTSQVDQDTLSACITSDQSGLQLVSSWDSLLGDATQALAAYSAVLRVLLPPTYPQQSYHHAWGRTMSDALAATSPQAMEQAKALVPTHPDRQTCRRMWLALHAAYSTPHSASNDPPNAGHHVPPALLPSRSTQDQSSPAEVLEMLASFAAEDDDTALQPLREGVAAALRQCSERLLQGLKSAANPRPGAGRASRPGSTSTSSDGGSLQGDQTQVSAPAESDSSDPGADTRTNEPSSTHSQVQQTYTSAMELVSSLQRSGLLQRLVAPGQPVDPRRSQPGATQWAVQGSATSPLDVVQGLDHALQEGLAASQWVTAAVGAATAWAACDLTAHVSNGEVTLLRQAAGVLAAAEQQLQDVRAGAMAVQRSIEQHKQTIQSYNAEMQEVQDTLQSVTAQAALIEPGTPAHDATQRQLQMAQQQLHALQQAQPHNDAVQRHLHEQGLALEREAATIMQQLYLDLLGQASLPVTLAMEDEQAWRAWLDTVVPAALTRTFKAQQLQGGAFGSPVPTAPRYPGRVEDALYEPQLPDRAPLGLLHHGPGRPVALAPAQVLLQSLPSPEAEDWGRPQIHHLMAAPTALLMHMARMGRPMPEPCLPPLPTTSSTAVGTSADVNDQGAQQPGDVEGRNDAPIDSGADDGLRLPEILQCWLPHTRVLRALSRLVEHCIAQAQEVAGAGKAVLQSSEAAQQGSNATVAKDMATAETASMPTSTGVESASDILPAAAADNATTGRIPTATAATVPELGIPTATAAFTADSCDTSAFSGTEVSTVRVAGGGSVGTAGQPTSGRAADGVQQGLSAGQVGSLALAVEQELMQLAAGHALAVNQQLHKLREALQAAGRDQELPTHTEVQEAGTEQTPTPAEAPSDLGAGILQLMSAGSPQDSGIPQGTDIRLTGDDLPPLVAFRDFDLAAPGQGMQLEEGALEEGPLEGSAGSAEAFEEGLEQGGRREGEQGFLAPIALSDSYALQGEVEGDVAAGVWGGGACSTAGNGYHGDDASPQHPNGQQDPGPVGQALTAGSAHVLPTSEEVTRLLLRLGSAGQCSRPVQAEAWFGQQDMERYVEGRQALRLHHLAAFAWIHEHALAQAPHPGDPLPSESLHAFFSEVPWNPLEPTARLRITSRQHLVVNLKALCEGWEHARNELLAWEEASTRTAMRTLSAWAAGGHRDSAQAVASMMQTYLARRRAWMSASHMHAAQLAHTCTAVVQFEVSRQGAAWAPGSPLVMNAFMSCSGLLSKVEVVYAALGDQHTHVMAAQEQCKALQAQAQHAAAWQQRAQAQQAAHEGQLAFGLPLLAMLGVQLEQAVDALTAGLPAASALMCKELGPVLRDLVSIIGPHPAARDVASLAAAVVQQHTVVAGALGALADTSPALQQGLEGVAAQHPLPPAVMGDLQAGRIPKDTVLVAGLARRGSALLESLHESLAALTPHLAAVQEMPSLLPRLASSMDSLAAAAASVATAIQSEHALDPEGEEEEEGESGEKDKAKEGDGESQARAEQQGAGVQLGQGGAVGPGTAAGGREGDERTAGGVSPAASGSTTPVPSRTATPPPPGVVNGSGTGAAPTAAQPPAAAAGTRRGATGAAPPGSRTRARQAWMMGHGVGAGKAGVSAAFVQQQEVQRKAYAVAALRRCIQKLEGKDSWDVQTLLGPTGASVGGGSGAAGGGVSSAPVGRALSVPQQVEALVHQAESPDLLCRMFEGWMPWL